MCEPFSRDEYGPVPHAIIKKPTFDIDAIAKRTEEQRALTLAKRKQ